jgi:hypothetical protein
MPIGVRGARPMGVLTGRVRLAVGLSASPCVLTVPDEPSQIGRDVIRVYGRLCR